MEHGCREKEGPLKVKPEIGHYDNNFKRKTNYGGIFVEEFGEVPFILSKHY